MALKLHHRDGTTTTITDAEQREIEEYTKGKSLAEIANEPPKFRHLAERRDPPPPPRSLKDVIDDFLAYLGTAAPPTREFIEAAAFTYGITPEPGESDEALKQRIYDRLRMPPVPWEWKP